MYEFISCEEYYTEEDVLELLTEEEIRELFSDSE